MLRVSVMSANRYAAVVIILLYMYTINVVQLAQPIWRLCLCHRSRRVEVTNVSQSKKKKERKKTVGVRS